MKKINFMKFDVFTDISKRQRVQCDMRRSVANLLYNQMHGIEALNLALKVHNSEGVLSVTGDELRILKDAVERFGTPALIDAFAEHVAAHNENPENE